MSSDSVSIRIPRSLHDLIQELIKGSDFSSVEEFVLFVLKDVVYENREEKTKDLTPYEVRRIKDKLKILGYL